MTSAAEQDYIKSIFALQQRAGSASTSALARKLHITPASVSGMLRKLDRAALISHDRYRGVKLTKLGERYAAEILRRHRLLELFLVKVLGMPWDSVHHEAEVLEHAVSDAVLERIDKLLGHPRQDPHGSPIPSSQGKLPATDTVRVDEMTAGQAGKVREVEDDEPALLQHMKKIGLVPGARIELLEIQAVDSLRIVRCGRKRQTISPRVAAAVRVDVDR